MKKILFLIAMAVGFLDAAGFRIEYGQNVVISQPVNENLYIMGGTITINAPIRGDLIIAGGTVVINDTVANDIIVAGGEITFNGWVGDDIRCMGGNIFIRKNVRGEVVLAGGNMVVDKGVDIGGLLASGGNISIDGNVKGDMVGVFGTLFLNGDVSKDVDLRGGKVTINGTVGGNSILAARSVIVGKNGSFNGDLRYWNRRGELDFKNIPVKGKTVYDDNLRIRTGEWYYLGAATILGLLWYLGMALLLIFIVQYLFSSTMKKSANTVYDKTLQSIGIGFLFFIVMPVLMVIALVTLIGIPLAVMMAVSYLALLLLSSVITSIVAANWINNRNNFNWSLTRIALISLCIFIVLKLLLVTPFFGWLVISLLVSASFGAILLNINWRVLRTKEVPTG